ncbi:DUF982 domain-containing protein [Neorhizobium alkalisoli]|uniref:DUF982 domain-containing protein n=1 Tax=Neorhizobium alkalisoli TaxID=528178 RepID=UPI000CF94BE7|nr:DUF982 domain-containing protein [Neorhizobium alkalisoli]
MIADRFTSPVTIFVGLGFPLPIYSVMEAYRYLADCPHNARDKWHTLAKNACAAAIRGEVEPDTARGLFAAFAERHQLLAPETFSTSLSPGCQQVIASS